MADLESDLIFITSFFQCTILSSHWFYSPYIFLDFFPVFLNVCSNLFINMHQLDLRNLFGRCFWSMLWSKNYRVTLVMVLAWYVFFFFKTTKKNHRKNEKESYRPLSCCFFPLPFRCRFLLYGVIFFFRKNVASYYRIWCWWL